jgi:vacuolar-type H+-ATPase catalytic subunit A/Vma1
MLKVWNVSKKRNVNEKINEKYKMMCGKSVLEYILKCVKGGKNEINGELGCGKNVI